MSPQFPSPLLEAYTDVLRVVLSHFCGLPPISSSSRSDPEKPVEKDNGTFDLCIDFTWARQLYHCAQLLLY